MRHDSVPIALPDEPTTHVSAPVEVADQPTHVVVWEQIDERTMRVSFVDPEASDGIPQPIEAERSATVAVVLVDMQEPLELIAQMARRDGINMNVVALPGPTGERDRVGVINATINGWRAFQTWFPSRLQEAEQHVIQSEGYRKGTAIMFRLKQLANDIQTQRPPNGFDLMVLRLEQ